MKIYISKKLEKLIEKSISSDLKVENSKPGKWNATVFYVERKKCWLITNGLTKYNVILTDMNAKRFKNFEHIFMSSLIDQLEYDDINVDKDTLKNLIGKIIFLTTDNDHKTIGFQNHFIEQLNWWKMEFRNLGNLPINDLTNRINSSPIHIGMSKKMSDYTTAIKEMRKILTK